MNNNETMRIDPESGEVMFSPEFQKQLQEQFESAREVVSDGVGQLMLKLAKTGNHQPDYLAAALMEAGLQMAVTAFGEEQLAAKLRQQIGESDDILDAITNTGATIVLDRLADGFQNAEQKEQKLRAEGWLTLEEGAKNIGISPEDLAERLEALDKRAEELGISRTELMQRIDDGEEEMV